ncbi:MAG: LamG domain-containing protein [Magnetococcales bacterium]|nr:LamG domain-containing protein [Magnetococcales bacterium]
MIATTALISISLPGVKGLVNRDKAQENERILKEARDAVEGFAVANHRLPCPSSDRDGDQDCSTSGNMLLTGYLPFSDLGLESGRDAYGGWLRYTVYGTTSTPYDDSSNPTNPSGTPSKRNFCAVWVNAPSSDTSYTHTLDDSGSAANVPFVIVSGGPSDADEDSSDERFDGNNEGSSGSAALSYDHPSETAVSGSYDDLVVDSSFNRSAVTIDNNNDGSNDSSTAISRFRNEVDCDTLVRYTFTGNEEDWSGNTYDGSLPASPKDPTLTTDRFGVSVRAYSFDSDVGDEDYISRTPTSNYVKEDSYSVSLWFNTSTSSTGLFSVTDGLPGAMSNWDRDLYLDSSGNVCARVWTGTSNYLCSSGTDYSSGNHYHVVHVLDGTTQYLYINGSLANSSNVGASTFTSETHIIIGWGFGTSPAFFSGTIDDVRVYNRALSAEEVKALYNAENP